MQYPKLEERIKEIYDMMIEVGDLLSKAENENKNQEYFSRLFGKETTSRIPHTEELMSIAGHEIMTIRDYFEFRKIPDILLENEQCWPVEPDLIY
jgi:hypothetical protein